MLGRSDAEAPGGVIHRRAPGGRGQLLAMYLHDGQQSPLPGTRQEAQAIQRLIPHAQPFLGPEATKQRLLQLPTPAILHLATHGFFLDDSPTPEDSRAVGSFGALGDSAPARRIHHPLLRSGLVLSGSS